MNRKLYSVVIVSVLLSLLPGPSGATAQSPGLPGKSLVVTPAPAGRWAISRGYQNVVVVAKEGGDFTSIQAALDSITGTVKNRYLVWVTPGIYYETVQMKPYVDIEGAGEGLTRVVYHGSSGYPVNSQPGRQLPEAAGLDPQGLPADLRELVPQTGEATIVGANNAELRFLTVENTGGDTYAIPILNRSASPRLVHVTVTSSRARSINFGVANVDRSSPRMMDVTVVISSTSNESIGVYNWNASPVISDLTISISGAVYVKGFLNDNGSAPLISQGLITISNSQLKTGIHNANASPIITDMNIVLPGGNYSTGVLNFYGTAGPSCAIVLTNVSISGASAGVFNAGGCTLVIELL